MPDLTAQAPDTRAPLAETDAADGLRTLWRRAGVAERAGYLVGVVLLASGALHGVVHLIEGTPWAGAVSWRKPTVFGLSFGVTLLCLTWIVTRLGATGRRATAIIAALSAASALEVGIITAQRWRGVPSHFNRSTPRDTALFITTGVGVLVVAALIVLITVMALRRLEASPAMSTAVRAGLGLLLVGQATGLAMFSVGMGADTAATASDAASSFTRAHGLSLHAIQVLPAIAWGAARITKASVAQQWIVRAAAVVYTLLVTLALL